jgi:hypothetical protein
VCEEKLWGFDQEKRHEEKYDEGDAEDEDADIEPFLNVGDDGVKGDFSYCPRSE